MEYRMVACHVMAMNGYIATNTIQCKQLYQDSCAVAVNVDTVVSVLFGAVSKRPDVGNGIAFSVRQLDDLDFFSERAANRFGDFPA